MPRPLLIFNQPDYLIQVVDTNSNTEWQTDLDLHCLQRQDISGFSRTRIRSVVISKIIHVSDHFCVIMMILCCYVMILGCYIDKLLPLSGHIQQRTNCWIVYAREQFSFFSPEYRIWRFMQIVTNLMFHANCLQCRQFAWNVKSCFLRKIR